MPKKKKKNQQKTNKQTKKPEEEEKKKKKKRKEKGKADLTTVLHIRELPHLHMKLAVWFSFPTTNNKNPMIPSWSLVSIYNYSFNPDQIFTKNFEILELEICSKIFICGMIFLQVNSSLPTSLKTYVLAIKSCIVPVKKPFIKERFDKNRSIHFIPPLS